MRGAIYKCLAIATALVFAPECAFAITATANATVVTILPMTLVKTDDLDFGSLIASTTAGTVTINPTTDARTTTGGVTASGGAPAAARFAGVGKIGLLTSIALPNSITLTRVGGTEQMTVGTIQANSPTLILFPGTGVLDLRIGGTLAVAANQAVGAYLGQFAVTVAFY